MAKTIRDGGLLGGEQLWEQDEQPKQSRPVSRRDREDPSLRGLFDRAERNATRHDYSGWTRIES